MTLVDYRPRGAAVGFKSGVYYTVPAPNVTTVGTAQGDCRAVGLKVDKTTSFDRIACEVTTAGTGTSVMRLGIYADDGGGYPGALLLDAGTIDATSTGSKQITIAVTLTPGVWWLPVSPQTITGSPVLRGTNSPYLIAPKVSLTDSAGFNSWKQTGITGALPAAWSSSKNAEQGYLVWLRAA